MKTEVVTAATPSPIKGCLMMGFCANKTGCAVCGFNPKIAQVRKYLIDNGGLSPNSKGLRYLKLPKLMKG